MKFKIGLNGIRKLQAFRISKFQTSTLKTLPTIRLNNYTEKPNHVFAWIGLFEKAFLS